MDFSQEVVLLGIMNLYFDRATIKCLNVLFLTNMQLFALQHINC